VSLWLQQPNNNTKSDADFRTRSSLGHANVDACFYGHTYSRTYSRTYCNTHSITDATSDLGE